MAAETRVASIAARVVKRGAADYGAVERWACLYVEMLRLKVLLPSVAAALGSRIRERGRAVRASLKIAP